MKRIPIKAAKEIAEKYGYDQVVIIARKVGEDPEPHGEHVTTYGRTKEHCAVAAQIGNFLTTKVMGWIETKKQVNQLPKVESQNLEQNLNMLKLSLPKVTLMERA